MARIYELKEFEHSQVFFFNDAVKRLKGYDCFNSFKATVSEVKAGSTTDFVNVFKKV